MKCSASKYSDKKILIHIKKLVSLGVILKVYHHNFIKYFIVQIKLAYNVKIFEWISQTCYTEMKASNILPFIAGKMPISQNKHAWK